MKIGYFHCCLLASAVSMATIGGQNETGQFALGVEYMVPGLAEAFAKTGVTWAKAMATGAFLWKDIEPKPPVNGKHTYNWEPADKLILEYQRAGFRNFHIYVRCMNPWASSKPLKLVGTGSHLPKPEYMEDYKAFLRALVQRYDTHHPNHVPGLLYPVEYWEIEAEWGTGFWQGTLPEYLELLKVANSTIKQANPRAKIILIGFFLAGLFEGHPDPQEIPSTLAKIPPARRRNTEQYLIEMKELLAHPELFDVAEFHSLSDWSEISGMARFIRQTMRHHGYEKPVWVGDVNYTASPLMFWGMPIPPYTEKQKPAIDATIKALSNPRNPRHNQAMAWFRLEQARGLVKKTVLAMAEGMAGINIGNLKDEDLFAIVPWFTGTVAFQGLIETKGNPPSPGEPRPAYHALALLAQRIASFTSIKQLELGHGVYAYQFTIRGRQAYILWYDDGKRYLPGDNEPVKLVELSLPQRQYLLTEMAAARGTLPTRTVSPVQGILKLAVGATPLLLE